MPEPSRGSCDRPAVEIEARLERNAFDRGAHRLAADLKRIAGQTEVTHRPCAGKLHGAGGAHVVQYAACAAGSIETGEHEDLAGDEPTGLIGVHHPGQRGEPIPPHRP